MTECLQDPNVKRSRSTHGQGHYDDTSNTCSVRLLHPYKNFKCNIVLYQYQWRCDELIHIMVTDIKTIAFAYYS